MGHSIFGWDLPPGCRVSDIPGNRPEDERLEAIELGFYNSDEKNQQKLINGRPRFTPQEWKYMNSKNRTKHLEDIIWKAIEYGMEIGGIEANDNRQENQYYESRFIEEALQKDNVPQATIDKVIRILKGDYETP